ncbi:thermosome subunit alpha [Salarchaeum sp. III]|uniref:thermosome subunit alpha n=1 Tax=Salarchaeum sp. III TaxID=3107927 RepID=UPI002ED810F9
MFIVSESSSRRKGRDARSMNIAAGRAMAEAVRTTLGPKGMDKMLVDSDGSVLVTNDGVSVLHEMDLEHPAARMIREVTKSQVETVGDGTTSAAVLVGSLLGQAEDLLDQDVHATVISNGYRKAATKATDILEATATEPNAEIDHLRNVATTALTGKGTGDAADQLAGLVVSGVLTATSDDHVNTANIAIETIPGRSVAASTILDGVLLEAPTDRPPAAHDLDSAEVALVDGDVALSGFDGEYTVSDTATFGRILDHEGESRQALVTTLVELGMDVLLSTGEIDAEIRGPLVDQGVTCLEEVGAQQFSRVATATGAGVVPQAKALTVEELGGASAVSVRALGGRDRLVIEGSADRGVATLLLRGGTDHVVDKVERAVRDAIAVVAHNLVDGRSLPGGGATEVAIAGQIREYANSVAGREQLAIEAFADALEAIPRTLAENAGLDPIDALVELRTEHTTGNTGAGIDAHAGSVADMWERGVVEPLHVHAHAIQSATEAAVLILRVDDVIAAGDLAGGEEEPERASTSGFADDTASAAMAVPEPVSGSVARAFASVSAQEIGDRDESIITQLGTESRPGSHGGTRHRTKETIDAVSAPSWVPPQQRFPLRLQWTGNVEAVNIHGTDSFEVVEVVGEDPDVTTAGGRTKVAADELGDYGTLLVYLRTTDIPAESTAISLPVSFEFESGTTRSTRVQLDVLRAALNAEATSQLPTQNRARGVDISLENTGALKALVDVEAVVDGEPAAIPGGGVWNLLQGFLNIGLHRFDAAKLDPVDKLDAQDRALLERACEDVVALLDDDVPPPEHYSRDGLRDLREVLETMLDREQFTPLEPHLDDVRLAYLIETAAVHPDESVQFTSVVDGIDVPQSATEIDIVIRYEDPNGTTYEPIHHTVSLEETTERACVLPVNLRVSRSD